MTIIGRVGDSLMVPKFLTFVWLVMSDNNEKIWSFYEIYWYLYYFRNNVSQSIGRF